MNEARKKHLIFSLLMAFFAGSTVVFVSVSVNNGFNSLFFEKWLRGVIVSYLVLVPFIFFVAPIVQKLAGRIFENWFNT
jgi:hypothetical protein